MPRDIEGTYYRLAESLTGTFKRVRTYTPSLSLFACLIEPLKRFVAIMAGNVVVWARSVAGRKECGGMLLFGNVWEYHLLPIHTETACTQYALQHGTEKF